jgi:hypothetical protein
VKPRRRPRRPAFAGPDSFTQTSYFNADGTLDRIVATGLAANVQGEQSRTSAAWY